MCLNIEIEMIMYLVYVKIYSKKGTFIRNKNGNDQDLFEALSFYLSFLFV